MKNIMFFILVFLAVVSVNSQKKNSKLTENKITSWKSKQCSENSDSLYNRQKVLEQFADILNSSIPEFKELNTFAFSAENEKPIGFGIYDLTDPSNKYLNNNDCINFVNNHIYHVFPFTHDFSFNHIVILENGNLKVFKSINCKDRGNSIEEVLDYLNQKLFDTEENKKQILERVTNYRKYGEYARMDNFSRLLCEKAN